MERILALDIGDVRIGIAVSDPFGTYALPVETYTRKNIKTDIEYILKIACEKCATKIVCGLPVNFDGSPSIQTDKTGHFIDRLKAVTEIPVETIDERFTTVEAENELINASGMKRKDRKKCVDSLAATYILESYLNSHKKA